MDFFHGLAVILILFKGIMIIQCNGTAPIDGTSLNWIQYAPIIDVSGDEPFLPNHLIELIIGKSDFETAQRCVRSRIVNATNTVMSGIFRDRIIVVYPHSFDGNNNEYYEDGDLFLRFGSHRRFVSLFDRFGDQIKKIQIYYYATISHMLRTEINQNIINRCANNLEELRILAYDDTEIWEEMSNGDNCIIFPEVKKFQFFGGRSQNKFKWNLIFPKIESIKLTGYLNDIDCLSNMTTLKELKLNSQAIQEHQLYHIFANNKNMTMLSLTWPRRAETMHAIAKDLTKLETLEIKFPYEHFLFRSNNSGLLLKLSSVTHFNIVFARITDLMRDLSFDMPHLKKLSLKGNRIDNRIIKFINYFKELETIELLVRDYNPVECIETLKHIREFTANSFEDSQLCSLRIFFEHFDKKSKLQTLKLWLVENEDENQTYEDTMQEINIHLAKSMKPTWTLSHGQQRGTDRKYLMFKRERSN